MPSWLPDTLNNIPAALDPWIKTIAAIIGAGVAVMVPTWNIIAESRRMKAQAVSGNAEAQRVLPMSPYMALYVDSDQMAGFTKEVRLLRETLNEHGDRLCRSNDGVGDAVDGLRHALGRTIEQLRETIPHRVEREAREAAAETRTRARKANL